MASVLALRDSPVPRRVFSPYEQAILTYAGAQLREARQRKGWSLREMAEALGAAGVVRLKHGSIDAIEKGRSGTSFATLCYLADFLGLGRTRLFPPPPGEPAPLDQEKQAILDSLQTEQTETLRLMYELARAARTFRVLPPDAV